MASSEKKPTVTPLFFKNYMSVLSKSAGTESFQHWYCLVDGVEQDVARGGDLSCALYATSMLKVFGLVEEIQITVHRALAEMERCGWHPVEEARAGAVVLWDERDTPSGRARKHIGFCLGDGKAISNRDEIGKPMIDDIAYRPILGFFWHEKLERP